MAPFQSAIRNPKSAIAFTLVETLIAAFLIGLVLVLVAQGSDYVRNQLRTQRTWELLGRLNQAMDAYRLATGEWPSGRGPAQAAGAGAGQAQPAANDSQRAPREDVRDGESSPDGEPSPLPGWLEQPADRERREARAAIETGRRVLGELLAVPASKQILDESRPAREDAPTGMIVQDGWGQPLRCLTAHSESPIDRQAVAANGGRPIFISTGPAAGRERLASRRVGDVQRSDEMPR